MDVLMRPFALCRTFLLATILVWHTVLASDVARRNDKNLQSMIDAVNLLLCKNDQEMVSLCRACAIHSVFPLEDCCRSNGVRKDCGKCLFNPLKCQNDITPLENYEEEIKEDSPNNPVMMNLNDDYGKTYGDNTNFHENPEIILFYDKNENNYISDKNEDDYISDKYEDDYISDKNEDDYISDKNEDYGDPQSVEAYWPLSQTFSKRYGTLFFGRHPLTRFHTIPESQGFDIMKRGNNDKFGTGDKVVRDSQDKRWGKLGLGGRRFKDFSRRIQSQKGEGSQRVGKRWGYLGIGKGLRANGKMRGSQGIGKRWGYLGIGKGLRANGKKWRSQGIGKRWGYLGIGKGLRSASGKKWGSLSTGNKWDFWGGKKGWNISRKKSVSQSIGKRWGSLGISKWTHPDRVGQSWGED